MFSAKIFTVQGENVTYQLRRMQSLFTLKAEGPEAVIAALQRCQTEEELLDFYFSTDYHVDEQFIQLFEERLQELESHSL